MPERTRVPRVLDACPEARPFSAIGGSALRRDPAREAYERGRAEGRAEAEAALTREIDAARHALADSLREAARFQDEMARRNDVLLVEIALAAASRIVRERIDGGDPVAVRAIREGAQALPPSAKIRVRVHPEDAEAVASQLASDLETGRIELGADPSVRRGGCVLESDVGNVDATLEAAEDAVRSAVVDGSEVP